MDQAPGPGRGPRRGDNLEAAGQRAAHQPTSAERGAGSDAGPRTPWWRPCSSSGRPGGGGPLHAIRRRRAAASFHSRTVNVHNERALRRRHALDFAVNGPSLHPRVLRNSLGQCSRHHMAASRRGGSSRFAKVIRSVGTLGPPRENQVASTLSAASRISAYPPCPLPCPLSCSLPSPICRPPPPPLPQAPPDRASQAAPPLPRSP